MPHAAPRAPPNNLCFTSSIIFPDTKLLLTRKHRPKYTQSNLYFARMSAESMLLLRLYGQTGYLLTLPRSLLKNDQPTQHADPALLTRRQWLGRLPAPAIAPTLGAGFLGENSAGQSPCLHSRSRNSRLQRPKLRRKGRWRHPRHSSISHLSAHPLQLLSSNPVRTALSDGRLHRLPGLGWTPLHAPRRPELPLSHLRPHQSRRHLRDWLNPHALQ